MDFPHLTILFNHSFRYMPLLLS
ncbi:CRISPR-associated DxTHG motif protein [Tannerella forsythia]|nr:CRISPR-associated DxTHG motif protein [Tannerella forsythia]